MKLQHASLLLGFAASSLLALVDTAQAASFSVDVSQKSDPKADILLNSITQNGQTFTQFNWVKSATVLQNTPIQLTGKAGETARPDAGGFNNNTGAASTDRGDQASKPNGLEVSGLNNPTGQEIATYVGNTNLNNIIDTEDNGGFKINLFFKNLIKADQTGLDNLFFFERGMNSDLRVQAIDAAGNLIGNSLNLLRGQQMGLGYQINTTEINGAQNVGGWGVSLLQLGVQQAAGIQVFAQDSFDGPDFKVIARQNTQPVPEPASLMGLGLMAGLFCVRRRVKSSH